MNHDVDDIESSFSPQERSILNPKKSRILSRIRTFNNLAISSIGSAFSGPLSAMGSYVFQEQSESLDSAPENYDIWDYACDLEAARTPTGDDRNDQRSSGSYGYYDVYNAVETSTPTQTRTNSPPQALRISDVKRMFSNFARSRQVESSNSNVISPSNPRREQSIMKSHNLSTSEPLTTPPLTPDTFDELDLPSPALSGDYESHSEWNTATTNQILEYYDDRSDEMEYNHSQSHSLEIKEGKKPERAVCYDLLIEGPPSTEQTATKSSLSPAILDDRDEWYGLEYTLELSSRERLPSDTRSFSAGEHSKSRESWAAIHQGTIHPFFEDEDYYQWKNWHRHLDRQDERRKHRKGLEFKVRSKDLAWFYADEMRTRDVMYWQKEVYGVIAREVKDRLNMLAEHRPDPYAPEKKHNFGWYLKRSRSVACLRELRPLPSPKWINATNRAPNNALPRNESTQRLNINDYSMFFEDCLPQI